MLLALSARAQLVVTGDVNGTHDPALAAEDGRYYIYATGNDRSTGGLLPVRCSPDLLTWTRCGSVFPAMPAWIQQMSPQTHDLWAPDISFFDGLFHLYYAFSVFGKNTSGIALATSPTLDPATARWTDRGLVVRSQQGDDFNAIDPNLILDERGDPWLAFGSFWSGIKLHRIDRATGLLSPQDKKLYALANRGSAGTTAVEAPFVFRHGGYYYLFVAWDLCCRGAKSTYSTVVGRSKSLTGPYLDRQGKPMLQGGGTPVLTANAVWAGPGGASLLHTPERDLIAFHAYSVVSNRPALQISVVEWHDGWPVAALADH